MDPQLLEYLQGFITPHKRELFESVLNKRTRYLTVVLEDIYQSHNASAVLRSCDCFGVQDLHIIENYNRWEPSRDVERGSSKWLTLHRYNSSEENTIRCINKLKSDGYQVVATTPHSDLSLEDLPLNQPIALIFGAEKKGVSQTVFDLADARVKIPMYGFTESFNISVAAALSLYSLRQRFEREKIDISLKKDEKHDLLCEWTRKVIDRVDILIADYYKRLNGS